MHEPTVRSSFQWNVEGEGLGALTYTEVDLPALRDNEVLVRIRGASLNYRDLLISQGQYPWEVKPGVVPGSDGAGVVLAVGQSVTRFRPGDKVITMLNQQHLAGSLTHKTNQYQLGASVDGTFRVEGAFDEQGLVAMPEGLSFVEAATLSCAGLTAWNALFGLPGKKLTAGQWVLTQGTGGVSIFALQFAKMVGARVIATTGSPEKVQMLESLGADHIINYRTTPNWGAVAKDFTGGSGVDIVVDVAGKTTLGESVDSLKLDGLICVVGFVGGEGGSREVPTLLDTWANLYTSRGLWVGSRQQMEEMCRAIEGNSRVRPLVDPKVFPLEQLREAYEYLSSGKHQGKVGIEIK